MACLAVDKDGTELEVVKSWCSCSGDQYQCIMPDRTQQVLCGSMIEVTDETPYIDWDEFYRNASVAILSGINSNPNWGGTIEEKINSATKQALMLTKILKESKL